MLDSFLRGHARRSLLKRQWGNNKAGGGSNVTDLVGYATHVFLRHSRRPSTALHDNDTGTVDQYSFGVKFPSTRDTRDPLLTFHPFQSEMLPESVE